MEHVLDYFGIRNGNGEIDATNDPFAISKPSIFDLQAQESTKELLRPLLRQFLFYLKRKLPLNITLERMFQRFEEIYLAFDIAVEGISLLLTRATVCEHYYGMKRANANNNGSLNNFQTCISLMESVLIPYITRKIKSKVELLKRGGEGDTFILNKKFSMLMSGSLVVLTGYKMLNWILKIIYVFSKKLSSPSLLMFIFGIKYCQRSNKDADRWGSFGPLATVMYILRFTQWYQHQQQEHQLKAMDNKNGIIPPPLDFPPILSETFIEKGSTTKGCPLCSKEVIERPVALPSGRVFCEACLMGDKIFKEQGRCPLTMIKIVRTNNNSNNNNHDGMRRLFVQAP